MIDQHTISRYDNGALSAWPNSWTFAPTLAFRVLMLLIASLILFRGLCFEFLIDPFTGPREKGPAFRDSQRSFAV